MSPEDFERIRWASHVLSREELEAREQAFQKEKEAIMVAALPEPRSLPMGRGSSGQGALAGGAHVCFLETLERMPGMDAAGGRGRGEQEARRRNFWVSRA